MGSCTSTSKGVVRRTQSSSHIDYSCTTQLGSTKASVVSSSSHRRPLALCSRNTQISREGTLHIQQPGPLRSDSSVEVENSFGCRTSSKLESSRESLVSRSEAQIARIIGTESTKSEMLVRGVPPSIRKLTTVSTTSGCCVVLPFKDFISFFRIPDSIVGMMSPIAIKRPRHSRDTLDHGTSNTLTCLHISPIIIFPSHSDCVEESQLTNSDSYQQSQNLSLGIPSVAQHVIYPNTISELGNLQRSYLSKQLLLEHAGPAYLKLPNTTKQVADKNCKSQRKIKYPSKMWEMLLAVPSIHLKKNIDAGLIICQRTLLFVSSFLSPPKSITQSSKSSFESSPQQPTISCVEDRRKSLPTSQEAPVDYPMREWNSERRRLRTRLFMADRYASEIETLVLEQNRNILEKKATSSHVEEERQRCEISQEVLPSYIETGDLLGIPTDHGGIDGGAILPFWEKGCLIAEYQTNSNAFLSLHHEIESLCNGLIWKKILIQSEGWRIPTPSCAAHLRLTLIDSGQITSKSQKVELIEKLLQCPTDPSWMTCSLPLSPPLKHFDVDILDPDFFTADPDLSSLILPVLQATSPTVINTSNDAINLVNLLLCQCARIVCRTMRQGETCIVSIPAIDLLITTASEDTRSPRENESHNFRHVAFLFQLESWHYVRIVCPQNNLSDPNKDLPVEAILSIDRYMKTVTHCSPLLDTKPLIDVTPKPSDTVIMEIWEDEPVSKQELQFVLPSSSSENIPIALLRAIELVTVGSTARLVTSSSFLNHPFWKLHSIHWKKPRLHPSSRSLMIHLSLRSIARNDTKITSSREHISRPLITLLEHVGVHGDVIPPSLVPYNQALLAIADLTEAFEAFVGSVGLRSFSCSSSLPNGLESIQQQQQLVASSEKLNYEKLWLFALNKVSQTVVTESGITEFQENLAAVDLQSLCFPTSIHLDLESQNIEADIGRYTIAGVHFYLSHQMFDEEAFNLQLSQSRQLFSDFLLQGECPPLASLVHFVGSSYVGIPCVPADWASSHHSLNSILQSSSVTMSEQSPAHFVWYSAASFLVQHDVVFRNYSAASLSKLNGVAALIFSSSLNDSISSSTTAQSIVQFLDLLASIKVNPLLSRSQPCPYQSSFYEGVFWPVVLTPCADAIPQNHRIRNLVSLELQFLHIAFDLKEVQYNCGSTTDLRSRQSEDSCIKKKSCQRRSFESLSTGLADDTLLELFTRLLYGRSEKSAANESKGQEISNEDKILDNSMKSMESVYNSGKVLKSGSQVESSFVFDNELLLLPKRSSIHRNKKTRKNSECIKRSSSLSQSSNASLLPIVIVWNLDEGFQIIDIQQFNQLLACFYSLKTPAVKHSWLFKEIQETLQKELKYVSVSPLMPESLVGTEADMTSSSKNSSSRNSRSHNLFVLSGMPFSLWKGWSRESSRESSRFDIIFVPIFLNSKLSTCCRSLKLFRFLHSVISSLGDVKKKSTCYSQTDLNQCRPQIASWAGKIRSFASEMQYSVDSLCHCIRERTINKAFPEVGMKLPSIPEMINIVSISLKRFEISKIVGFWCLFLEFSEPLDNDLLQSKGEVGNLIRSTSSSIAVFSMSTAVTSNEAVFKRFLIQSIALYLFSIAFTDTVHFFARVGYPIGAECLLVLISQAPTLWLQPYSQIPSDRLTSRFRSLVLLSLVASFLRARHGLSLLHAERLDPVSSIVIADAIIVNAFSLPRSSVTSFLCQSFGLLSTEPTLESLLARNLTPETAMSSEPQPLYSMMISSNGMEWGSISRFMGLHFCSFYSIFHRLARPSSRSSFSTSNRALISLSHFPYEVSLFIRSKTVHDCFHEKEIRMPILASFLTHRSGNSIANLQGSPFCDTHSVEELFESGPLPLRDGLVEVVAYWQALGSYINPEGSNDTGRLSGVACMKELPIFSFHSRLIIEICRRFLSVTLESLVGFNPWASHDTSSLSNPADKCSRKAPQLPLRRLIQWVPDIVNTMRTVLLATSDTGAAIPKELAIALLLCDGLFRLIANGDVEACCELYHQALQAALQFNHPLRLSTRQLMLHWVTESKSQHNGRFFRSSHHVWAKGDLHISHVINEPPVILTEEVRLFPSPQTQDRDFYGGNPNRRYKGVKGTHPILLYISYVLSTIGYLRGWNTTEIEKFNYIFRKARLHYPLCPLAIGPPESIPDKPSTMLSRAGNRPPKTHHESKSQIRKNSDLLCGQTALIPVESRYQVPKPSNAEKKSSHQGSDSVALPLKWSVAEQLMWNLALVGPDLAHWFHVTDLLSPSPLPVIDVPELSENSSLSLSMDATPETGGGKSLLSPCIEMRQSEDQEQNRRSHSSPDQFYSVFTFGANFIAGCLGVGMPKYLRHDEQLYDLMADYREENQSIKSKGVDIWWSGTPIEVPRLEGLSIVSMACGEHHTLALTSTGRIFAWGSNKFGQCGGPYHSPNSAKKNTSLLEGSNTSSSQVFDRDPADCERWSSNYVEWSKPAREKASLAGSAQEFPFEMVAENICVDTVLENSCDPSSYLKSPSENIPPRMTEPLDDPDVVNTFGVPMSKGYQVSEHKAHGIYYDSDYLLPTCLTIPTEILGFWRRAEARTDASQQDLGLVFDQISAGASFSAAKTQEGILYLWGSTSEGCLGHKELMGKRIYENRPIQLHGEAVADAFYDEVTKTSPKFRHLSWARTSDIRIHLLAYHVDRLHDIVAVDCGSMHVGALDGKGGLWMWGLGEAGQLGIPYKQVQLLSRRVLFSGNENNEDATSRSFVIPQNEKEFSQSDPRGTDVHETSETGKQNNFTGTIAFPHRLRVFYLPLKSWNSNSSPQTHDKICDGISTNEVRVVLHNFLKQMGLSTTTDLLGSIAGRLDVASRALIVSLTDYTLLEHSLLDLPQLFGRSVCHSAEVKFNSIACGEGHSIAFGYINVPESKNLNELHAGIYASMKQRSPIPEKLDNSIFADNTYYSGPSAPKESLSNLSAIDERLRRKYLLFSWGQCTYGQLGVNFNRNPQRLLDLRAILLEEDAHSGIQRGTERNSLSLGGSSSCHYYVDLYESSSRNTPCLIFSWEGLNIEEELNLLICGTGSKQQDSLAPYNFHAGHSCSITGLRCGGCSSLALLSNGEALVWGSNDFGMLGTSEAETPEIHTPSYLKLPKERPSTVVDATFAMGASRLFVISSQGDVYALGKDLYGASGCYSSCKKPQAQFFHQQKLAKMQKSPHGIFRLVLPSTVRGAGVVSCIAGGAMHTTISVKTMLSGSSSLNQNTLDKTLQKRYDDLVKMKDTASLGHLSDPIPALWMRQVPRRSIFTLPLKRDIIDGVLDDIDVPLDEQDKTTVVTQESHTASPHTSARPSLSSLASSLGFYMPVNTTMLSQVQPEMTGIPRSSQDVADPQQSKVSSCPGRQESLSSVSRFHSGISSEEGCQLYDSREIFPLSASCKDSTKSQASAPSEPIQPSNISPFKSSRLLIEGRQSPKPQLPNNQRFMPGLQRKLSCQSVHSTSNHRGSPSRPIQRNAQRSLSEFPSRKIGRSSSEVFRDGLLTLGGLLYRGLSGLTQLMNDANNHVAESGSASEPESDCESEARTPMHERLTCLKNPESFPSSSTKRDSLLRTVPVSHRSERKRQFWPKSDKSINNARKPNRAVANYTKSQANNIHSSLYTDRLLSPYTIQCSNLPYTLSRSSSFESQNHRLYGSSSKIDAVVSRTHGFRVGHFSGERYLPPYSHNESFDHVRYPRQEKRYTKFEHPNRDQSLLRTNSMVNAGSTPLYHRENPGSRESQPMFMTGPHWKHLPFRGPPSEVNPPSKSKRASTTNWFSSHLPQVFDSQFDTLHSTENRVQQCYPPIPPTRVLWDHQRSDIPPPTRSAYNDSPNLRLPTPPGLMYINGLPYAISRASLMSTGQHPSQGQSRDYHNSYPRHTITPTPLTSTSTASHDSFQHFSSPNQSPLDPRRVSQQHHVRRF